MYNYVPAQRIIITIIVITPNGGQMFVHKYLHAACVLIPRYPDLHTHMHQYLQAGLLPVHPRHYLEASRKRATEATAVTTPNEATSGNETESSSGVGSNTEPDGTSSSDSDSGSDKEP